MTYCFTSVLAADFKAYINLCENADKYIKNIKTYLSCLDKHLTEHNVSDKNIPESVLSAWLASKDIKAATKANRLNIVRGFGRYMLSLGYFIEIPEPPRVVNSYTPYLFTADELDLIFSALDNFEYEKKKTHASVQAPVLFRTLYGCGFRLGEALLLLWDDVNLEAGTIIIHNAKNKKKRTVPLSPSLTEILKSYKQYATRNNICRNGLVFENRQGKSYHTNSVRKWFSFALEKAGIVYTRQTRERGPCIHCLRHTFVINSFLQADSEGRAFEEIVPFLTEYLGHKDIMETDKYLRASYIVYKDAHRKVNDYINDIFPEVN